ERAFERGALSDRRCPPRGISHVEVPRLMTREDELDCRECGRGRRAQELCDEQKLRPDEPSTTELWDQARRADDLFHEAIMLEREKVDDAASIHEMADFEDLVLLVRLLGRSWQAPSLGSR